MLSNVESFCFFYLLVFADCFKKGAPMPATNQDTLVFQSSNLATCAAPPCTYVFLLNVQPSNGDSDRPHGFTQQVRLLCMAQSMMSYFKAQSKISYYCYY